MKRLLRIGNALLILIVIAFAAVEFGGPVTAVQLWGDEYKQLMFQCDQAMRNHFIAKASVTANPNDKSIRGLQAAELGLLDCHRYDKLRKRLIVWGVSEPHLEKIGLEALEQKKYDLRRFVETHEIRY